ncbi:MFS transporter [Kineothrix sp. MB12-C1]|uniref:MFS transporter n=1 Tax=Kineothrix sp. MB12-C1 TaxID=3070215 RepID=UPI0027D1FBC3|nr:MFS transporter [Kineothrix sp. MB12-C1]WMC94142.1 MFS transporter [Kineothrix sp. MB12-C1]
MSIRKSQGRKEILLLSVLCWVVYISAYLGRLNYMASLAEIIRAERFTKEQAGAVGTGFFFTYGLGQLISGFLGDRLSPKWMVFGGLFTTGLVNAGMWRAHEAGGMMILWSINGLAQAFIWSPMIRIVVDYLEEDVRIKVCLFLNSAVPVGTMMAYGMTAAVIAAGKWRPVFAIASGVLLAMSLVWMIGMFCLERKMIRIDRSRTEYGGGFGGKRLSFVGSGLILVMIALLVQGALKDGVTTWVPVYIGENFAMSSSAAVLSTMLIPLSNLAGVWLAAFVDRNWGKGEIRTSGIFFLICGGLLLILWGSSGRSLLLSLAMLAMGTTAMMAVNTMLIAVLPSRFGGIGKASTVSGILNSTVYLGSALSTYGIGALSERWGWNVTILLWAFGAGVAAICCLAAVVKWKSYLFNYLSRH